MAACHEQFCQSYPEVLGEHGDDPCGVNEARTIFDQQISLPPGALCDESYNAIAVPESDGAETHM